MNGAAIISAPPRYSGSLYPLLLIQIPADGLAIISAIDPGIMTQPTNSSPSMSPEGDWIMNGKTWIYRNVVMFTRSAITAIIATCFFFRTAGSIEGKGTLFSQNINDNAAATVRAAEMAKRGDEIPSIYPRVIVDMRKNIDARRSTAPAGSALLPGIPGEEGSFRIMSERCAITTGIIIK